MLLEPSGDSVLTNQAALRPAAAPAWHAGGVLVLSVLFYRLVYFGAMSYTVMYCSLLFVGVHCSAVVNCARYWVGAQPAVHWQYWRGCSSI